MRQRGQKRLVVDASDHDDETPSPIDKVWTIYIGRSRALFIPKWRNYEFIRERQAKKTPPKRRLV
ncbi:hypothetical protein MRY16398_47010 [Phytobacter sp. MRY16-398]|nr:hypothetical protein MRY16398_47010 [Phytobacter sp. MRY16-398]